MLSSLKGIHSLKTIGNPVKKSGQEVLVCELLAY